MYRIHAAPDGTKTATCRRCGTSRRGFRSEKLLARWKTAHLNECRGGRGEAGAA